jgi:hypothetical protein
MLCILVLVNHSLVLWLLFVFWLILGQEVGLLHLVFVVFVDAVVLVSSVMLAHRLLVIDIYRHIVCVRVLLYSFASRCSWDLILDVGS